MGNNQDMWNMVEKIEHILYEADVAGTGCVALGLEDEYSSEASFIVHICVSMSDKEDVKTAVSNILHESFEGVHLNIQEDLYDKILVVLNI
jgi:hypothetical protein